MRVLGEAGDPSALEVDRVSRRFGEVQALDGVSCTFPLGVTALLGENGAGKSSLLRRLATVDRGPGAVRAGGRELSDPRGLRTYRTALGWMPQDVSAPGDARLRDVIAYAAWLRCVPRGRREAAVDHALSVVDLSDRSEARMRTLSGGMLRRAGLAQAMVHRPSWLLLDEPSAGLDPTQRAELGRVVRLLGQSAAVVLATHLLEDVVACCDRVVVLRRGRVAFEGGVEEFCDAPVTVEALGEAWRRMAVPPARNSP